MGQERFLIVPPLCFRLIRYIDHMVIEEGIARNKALRENLFVVLTCILNHIPVMVVGKPGTSKTLCMQLILENLRGAGSVNDFWKLYPSVTVFPYQCSPLSTAASIQKQYDAAVKFQEAQGSNSTTVLLLDEIGLAEFSPDMPLKVLHAILLPHCPPTEPILIPCWPPDMPPRFTRHAALKERRHCQSDPTYPTCLNLIIHTSI